MGNTASVGRLERVRTGGAGRPHAIGEGYRLMVMREHARATKAQQRGRAWSDVVLELLTVGECEQRLFERGTFTRSHGATRTVSKQFANASKSTLEPRCNRRCSSASERPPGPVTS